MAHDYEEMEWVRENDDLYVAPRGGWRLERIEGRWRARAPDGFVTRLYADRDLAMFEADDEQGQREIDAADEFRRRAAEADDPSWPRATFPR